MRWRRKRKIDRRRFPHDYIGPLTHDGLKSNTPCRIVGNRCHGRLIRTPDGLQWLVGPDQVRVAK